jgi:hypothetical protein
MSLRAGAFRTATSDLSRTSRFLIRRKTRFGFAADGAIPRDEISAKVLCEQPGGKS